MTTREAFGPTLQQQRQRRGVTLEAIAQTTKISRSPLASLERSDVSRWPGGIYRRSYFREYASAIGLSPEPAGACSVAPVDDESGALRLTLVPEPRWKAPGRHALAALLDGGAGASLAGRADRRASARLAVRFPRASQGRNARFVVRAVGLTTQPATSDSQRFLMQASKTLPRVAWTMSG